MPEADLERWTIGGRHFTVTLASTPDSMDLELDDVGPAPGRGVILMASRHDETGEMTLRCFTSEAIPLALVDQFVAEARRRLPPIE